MSKTETFQPDWYEGELPPRSFRALFRWNDPKAFKHPSRGFYRHLRDTFGMSDEDFKNPSPALEEFDLQQPPRLPEKTRRELAALVGEENASEDTFERVRRSYGAGMLDALRLRQRVVENLPDLVLRPRGRADVEAVVAYCDRAGIPVQVYGGGSSVTRAYEAVKGGVTLDLSAHMNRVIALNETDQTVTVEPGIWGPDLERILNNAPRTLGANRAYTVGHFPQSFEHSSVGGWVVTRGAGQNSTYYGKIEDMVRSQEYVTPRGILRTPPYPRCATGPDINQIMIGSEGTFGVLTEVTLRICRYQPENTRRFSYLFKSWEDGVNAYREVMQSEAGFPSVFRLSDPEETDVALRMYSIADSIADRGLKVLGFQPMARCMLLGSADGDKGYTALVARKVDAVCRRYGALNLSALRLTQRWEHSRFADPYMREDLLDHGIIIDTLECAVTWSQLPEVHRRVRAVVKARPRTICMTHMSHAYPQGTNLYFIFIMRESDPNAYLDLQYGVLQAIQDSGAAMSHHHGIGKQTAPWLEGQIGTPVMDVFRALKAHFDPRGILNPGGTLGFDLSEEQRAKRWGYRGRNG